MTQQQLFNNAWQHFVVGKGKPSMDKLRCRYRGPGGTKCALGISIPDSKYESRFDDDYRFPVSALIDMLGWSIEATAARDLRNCHDTTAHLRLSPARFRAAITEQLEGYASEYKLTIPMPGRKKER